MSAMALGLAACDESAPSVPPVQQNPQGPVMETTSLSGTAEGAFANGGVLNLQSYQANPDIPVLTLAQVDDMPDGGSAYTRLELSADENFSASQVFEMTMNADNATVNANELNEWHISTFGKSPVKEQTVYYRVPGYIMLNGTDYRVGSMDTYVLSGQYKELRYATSYVIEDAYYMLSDATTWNLTDAVDYAFAHNSDQDVYDAPEFTFTIEADQPGCTWQVAPRSAVTNASDATVLGVAADGDTALEGTLAAGATGKAKLEKAGKYLITINMEKSTYTVKEILYPDMLAARGGRGGWSTAGASWLRQSEDGLYKEAVVLDGSFKFVDPATGEDWVDPTTWGMGVEGELVNAGGSDIQVTEAAGTYWAIADLRDAAAMTYTLVKVTSVGVTGVNDWNADAPIELTSNEDGTLWTGDVDFNGGSWKIIINHSWDYNYGGSIEDPHFNWGNFFDGDSNAPDGACTVTFDLTGNLPVIQVVKK